MAKKGKEKATAPAPAPAPASQSAAGKTKNGPKDSKKGAAPSPMEQAAGPVAGPPKPTVKQIIGGSSWTGKLPVNLLNEHCQKQQWEKPEYDMRRTPEGYSCLITLSAKDPKTHEMTRLDPFKIPAEYKHLLTKPTALEARHCAATYGLFRVCSMQNKHTVLPPDYKSLWKEFQALKQKDLKEDKAWMYDADPFKTLRDRQDAKAALEKKRKEMERIREKAKAMPGAAGLSFVGTSKAGVSNPMKGWTNIPKIEMGKKSRAQVEALIQSRVIWNPNQVRMSDAQRQVVVADLSKLGFRRSHVEEAADICKDREETLEWLLIHVPEDDMPRWALPESYSAGITVGAMDLKKETAIKRLSESGYALDLCARVYEACGCDEGRAAEALQQRLMGSDAGDHPAITASDLVPSGMTAEELWEDEVGALESFFGGQFTRKSTDVIQVKLESVANGHQRDVEVLIQVRKSPNYPAQLVISVLAQLPAQVKLSITKLVLAFIAESYSEEPMKVFVAIDWIQQNINSVVENPGKLVEVSSVSSTASEAPGTLHPRPPAAKFSKHPRPTRWVSDARSREEWLRRQGSPKWKEMMSKRQQLPAWQARETIIEAVAKNHVTIISGETGSGKSTQSMQFVLDDLYSQGLGSCAKMFVTQPRRISALGLADRVAEERCSPVGQEVGYAIRGESRVSQQTRITFVTTGVLLRRLQTSGGRVEDVAASLADVSHIVIDEVHERSLDTDFLLTILREVMKTRKDLLRLVLMSATLDAGSFKEYFVSQGLHVGLVEIPGRTFPVEDFYLDDIVSMTGFRSYTDDVQGETMGKTIQSLGHRINYDLLTETIVTIDLELSYAEKTGGILVFLPGVAEINQTCRALSGHSSLYVLPLHASLETKEQKRVFGRAPPGKRKVVVATNVAETSITIDDIVAVVDSGKVKQTTFDPQNNMRKLEEMWASRAACKQRRGRAGRIQAGKCYKLFTRRLEQQMAERPEPEIRRVPLEQMCLSVRAMGVRDVASFLARSPTPPESTAVEGAMRLLGRMGALDGDELTALGQQLAMIPADLRCGKLMVYGAIFGCLDDSVTVSAILSTKSPFVSPPDKRDLAKEARMRFDQGDGDLLTDLAAYKEWAAMRADGAAPRSLRAFCDDNFLSFLTLSDIAATRTQYYAALGEIGIVSPREAGASADRRRQHQHQHQHQHQQDGAAYATRTMLRALTASAFSPQIARIQFPEKKFVNSVSGAVELDPEARMIKYFTQEQGRVFVHPSSTVFDSQGFSGNAAFMSYFSMISTSKTFIRDLTPFNAYTLLLFSGAIELDTMGRGLVVDGWLRLRGWARLGVLVSRLRGMVDDVIRLKVENPGLDLRDNKVIRTVARLIELDGLDA
ncbi:pre-mRNA-splicing factor ATP-dependent RNA helicase PRP43 [Sodiomyces alkalinus F11]|uniref:Pre-mRNA-splicing factor ATP-dependent RNA helicase PRP43 n=1 Tax=Sodiomyces alkalinus (strain CBS 110278 / VKM F-3762 / F11) TaxID=1314773 RepID=A0A3N2Q264_SODAK|nr:pre-mRNA-splicing factor ATP-dependent RNA helicase PRP43 [Sodiomyces alkalinus F11]ROT40849.1 pre-mRNA-splicing factor ATP-dependent RNA helicase PRP43 [Sodiomyces alkalinus F11]